MKTLARPDDQADLVRRLRTLRPDSPRRWGRMSSSQMVCHLADSFRVATGERQASEATSLLQRTLVKWIALYAPLSWPAGIRTRPEVDQEVGGTRPAEFAADVAEVEALIETVRQPASRIEARRHPIFGAMSRRAWLRWGYLHTDHHLRQFGA